MYGVREARWHHELAFLVLGGGGFLFAREPRAQDP